MIGCNEDGPDLASHDVDANEADIAVVRSASRQRLSDAMSRGPAKGLILTVSKKFVGIVLIAGLALSASSLVQNAMAQVHFASKQRAFTQGYSAFKSGRYDIAVPALKFAAERDVLRAKFYLAKIYSDNSGGFTDHARAYAMLRDIVSKHSHADPKDFRVARFVSKSLISIARYERDGIPALGLRPNTQRALQFFDHAASHFNDRDAQFELARHYLAGDGVEARVPYALNWLARLSKRGHAGAQAFLANLYWDGRYMQRDRVRALALITVAVENVQEEDRFWIEDLHHNIFCESPQETRRRVHRMVGGWRQRFGGTQRARRRQTDLAVLGGDTKRFCANGDTVGELIARATPPAKGSGLNGFSTATAAGRGTRAKPPNSKPGSLMMTRMKRERRTDRRSLNGFSLQSVGGRLPNGPETTQETLGKSDKSRELRSLNGFTLKGSTNFGFSSAPER